MKKDLFILFLLVLFPALAYNQTDSTASDPDQLYITKPESNPLDQKPALKNKLDTDFEAGTSFSYSPGNYYGPSYYIAPGLTYRFSPRFFLTTGMALQYSTFYPLYQQGKTENNSMPVTRAYLFARGSYFLTPRLIVNGTVYKSMMDTPRLTNYSGPVHYNYQGISAGFQYNVSKSFSFGVQVHTQNGYYQSDGLIPSAGYVPVPGF